MEQIIVIVWKERVSKGGREGGRGGREGGREGREGGREGVRE